MAHVVKITGPTDGAAFATLGSSISISGTSNMTVFQLMETSSIEVLRLLFVHFNQDDGFVLSQVLQMNPENFTVRGELDGSDGATIYQGSAIQPNEIFDEIHITLAELGPDPSPPDPGVTLISYDGDPAEPVTALGVSIASFTDADSASGDGRSPELTFRGEVINGLGTTAFAISSTTHTWQSDSPVPLEIGENTIKVYAKDDQDNEVSDTMTVTRTTGGGSGSISFVMPLLAPPGKRNGAN